MLARLDEDRLELTGNGERIDGLRALCAAAWAADSVSEQSVRPAIERLGQTDASM